MNDYDWIMNWGILYPLMLSLWVIIIGAIIKVIIKLVKIAPPALNVMY